MLLALVAVLLFWALRPGGGDGAPRAAGSDDSAGGPAESLTPGPTPTESLIDERPGGRQEADGGSDEDGEGDGGDAAGSGEQETPKTPEGQEAEGQEGQDGPGTPGEQQAGLSGGGSVAGLADCAPGAVTLSLRSTVNEYPPGEKPTLRLTAENTSGTACRLDMGHRELGVTVSDSADELVWDSATCPAGRASVPVAVAAGGTVTHAVEWNRRHSPADRADCGGAPGETAAPGTYLAEATLSGFPVAQTSFRLDQD